MLLNPNVDVEPTSMCNRDVVWDCVDILSCIGPVVQDCMQSPVASNSTVYNALEAMRITELLFIKGYLAGKEGSDEFSDIYKVHSKIVQMAHELSPIAGARLKTAYSYLDDVVQRASASEELSSDDDKV